jgi:DNA-binding response OmpR family regulator
MGETVLVRAVSDSARPLVLVVEDEPEIAALMRDFLEADGFGVLLAVDAEEAVEALRTAPDCVLLDVMLPGASGFDLCRDIRSASDVPVLFLSARGGDAAHEVHVAGRLVRMTAREFELLRVFVQHPRQVFSREHLFELLWGSHGDRSAVSVYISRLREKIGDDPADPRYIVTVWGAGYRFDGGLARNAVG